MNAEPSHDAALRLLASEPDRLESGLTILDRDLPLGNEVSLDLLARDRLGYPVIVLGCGADPTPTLARMASISTALRRVRPLLQRLHGERGLDPGLRPRFVLLSRRFSDDTPQLLDMVAALEVRAVEYRLVTGADGQAVLDLQPFHRAGLVAAHREAVVATEPAVPVRRATPPPADATPVRLGSNGHAAPPEPGEVLAGIEAPETSKRFFLRARDSIRSLSGHVQEEGSGGERVFHVDDGVLARLTLDRAGFHVHVGESELDVIDDGSFNASLNAVFTHYFDCFASRA